MEYLHTMVRISDVEASLDFWCDKLGLKEIRRSESEQGRYTLIFLAAPGDEARARSDASSPAGSTWTNRSTAFSTRWLTRISASVASSHSREARFATGPIAA